MTEETKKFKFHDSSQQTVEHKDKDKERFEAFCTRILGFDKVN